MLQLAQIRWLNPALDTAVSSLRGWEYFQIVLPDFVTLGMIIGVVVFVFVFIIGAIQWISAGADKGAIESARRKIVNAIVGLFILLLLFMILQLFNLIFGINIGNIGTPSGPGSPGSPTSTAGSCTCENWSIVSSNCASPNVPQCVTSTTCQCTSSNTLCYDSNVDYWRGCQDVASWTCSPPDTLICDPPTAACSSFWGAGAQCCKCFSASDPPPGLPDGSACTGSSQCTSGLCSDGVDADGDGYVRNSSGVCTPGPGDCNDNFAQVHPNQTNYFETPIGGSGTDFNYDCADSDADGNPNDKWPTLNCLSGPAARSCSTTPLSDSVVQANSGWRNSIPNCGESLTTQSFFVCEATHLNDCGNSPAVANVSCNAQCVTGNNCGGGGGQQCNSWNMRDWPVFSSFVGGRTRMPCK